MEGRRRLIASALEAVPRAGIVVDVAAGDGELSALVAERTGGLLLTCDRDRGECAASAWAGRATVRSDALHLPFRDAVADVTVAFEILEHFRPEDGRALIAEMRRVTRPGGTLLLSTPNRYSLRSLQGVARYLAKGTVWNGEDQTHITLYSRRSLSKALAGRFSVERCYGYYLVPEVRGHATRWTFVQTRRPPLVALCHKFLVVAKALP